MKRRLMTMVLTALLVLAAIPFASIASTSDNIIQGEANIADMKGFDFELDFKNLTSASNKVFHHDVAEAGILLSADFGDIGDITIADGDESLLKQLGFKNITTIELDDQVHETDPKDLVVFSMGRRLVNEGDKSYAVYAVAIRGTLQLREWASNMDMGSLNEDYTEQTGEHPEWLNTDHHKGFDIASRRVISLVDEYLGKYKSKDKNANRTIFITGHSRGAAVANLVGKEFEDRFNKSTKAIKPYTYTFGTPAVSLEDESARSSYKTIFNVVNDDDLVPCVPLADWGYGRYGKDIHISIENSPELKKLWESENMTEMTSAYTQAYGKKLLTYSPIPLDLGGTFAELMFAEKSYQSADADKVIKLMKTLVPGDEEDVTKSRDYMYEFRDIIWIPNDISEEYSNYYEEVPYDEDSTYWEKISYQNIAKRFDCKRVRISSYFMMIALDRITTAVLAENSEENIAALQEFFNYWPACNTGKTVKQKLATLAVILKNTSAVSEDIKVLMYANLIQSGSMMDDGDSVNAILKYILSMASKSSMGGMLYSHMPTTYYFMVEHMADTDL